MEYKGYEIVVQYCTNTVYQLDDEGNRTIVIEENDDYLDYYRIEQAGEWDQQDYPETLDEAKKIIDDSINHELEELRQALRDENISIGELIRLGELADYIEPGDVELLEPAGVPEFNEEN